MGLKTDERGERRDKGSDGCFRILSVLVCELRAPIKFTDKARVSSLTQILDEKATLRDCKRKNSNAVAPSSTMSISRVQDEMASIGIEGPTPSSFILKLFQMTNEAPDDVIAVSF